MKPYAIQSENGIMMNVDVSVKNQMIGVLVKMIVCGNVASVIANAIKHVKPMNTQILKFAFVKKL